MSGNTQNILKYNHLAKDSDMLGYVPFICISYIYKLKTKVLFKYCVLLISYEMKSYGV